MPLTENERKALEKVGAILRERYGALDIWLYGSKARGTDTRESDIDVMVVMPETSREVEAEIDHEIFDVNLEHDCLISTVYFSERELRVGPMSESPLYKRGLAEGVRL